MATKFHMGDTVFSPHFGKGIVVEVDDNPFSIYPIHVRWTDADKPRCGRCDIFTSSGQYSANIIKSTDFDIIPIEEAGKEMGQISGVINYNIAKKEKEDNEKMSPEDEKFHVGDRVHTNFYGEGVIIATHRTDPDYPIAVKWDSNTNTLSEEISTFTEDGYLFYGDKTEDTKITKVKADMEFTEKDDGTIERMEDALNKKVEDAVNPAHYKVEGLSEAIDIINHLMHREEYEGFLWGNILKYAYRFGRKGDKAETAGKIEWYAKQLKELEEEHK